MLQLLAVIFSCLLFSCNNVVPLEPALNSQTSSTVTNSNCASCHTYPVLGVNHQFHLFHADSLKLENGPITCLDCHNHSILSQNFVIHDSVYKNLRGSLASAYDRTASPAFRDSLTKKLYTLVRVDTLIQHRPVPAPGTPDRISFLQEWVTSIDHLNGKVDVKFDPNDQDLVRFNGFAATYNPTLETCSAIKCHNSSTPYRWPAPSKGLDGLNVSTSAN